MRIGLIDADLLDQGTRHPNLALMKISGYLKGITKVNGKVIRPTPKHQVRLLLDQDLDCSLEVFENTFDKIIVSCVFDFTRLPRVVQDALDRGKFVEGDGMLKSYSAKTPKFVFGGTGFIPYIRKQSNGLRELPNNLPFQIEHNFPDYDLYAPFLERERELGKDMKQYKDYMYYSIGFATRGCFRHCPFCVNRMYKHVTPHSPIDEFLDPDRKYIYLWDDNFLGLIDHADPQVQGKKSWERILQELKETGKPFQFRQGLDIRLMTPEIAKILSSCRYHGDYIFAFDHYSQKKQIVTGLLNWKRENPDNIPKFYVFCGFRHEGREVDDIYEILKRIRILMHFGAIPYVMRHVDYKKSPFRGLYTQLARWCNQPQFLKKKSFNEFIEANEAYHRKAGARIEHCASFEARALFCRSRLTTHPTDGSTPKTTRQIADEFFCLRWEEQRDLWKSGDFGEPELNESQVKTN